MKVYVLSIASSYMTETMELNTFVFNSFEDAKEAFNEK